MPRAYRLLIVATCGIAVFIALGTGAFVGSLYSPEHKQYQSVAGYHRSQHDYSGPSQSLPNISGLPDLIERGIANPGPATGEDHERRDLAAQEASALWAFWMVFASFASVAITAVGTAFLYKQIVLTREAVQDTGDATDAMRDANMIAKEANRPWVKITPPPYASIFREGDSLPGIVIPIGVKNFGESPAVGLSMMVGIHPSGDMSEADVIRRVADIAAFSASGISLYPNEESTLGERATFLPTIMKSRNFDGDIFDPSKLIYLTVSIFYKSIATERVYHTSIFFFISANIPEIPVGIDLEQVGREYHGAVEDHHYTYDEEYHRRRE